MARSRTKTRPAKARASSSQTKVKRPKPLPQSLLAFEKRTAALQRAGIVIAAFLPGIVFFPRALDAFDIVKLTVVVLAAAFVVVLGIGRTLCTGRLSAPVAAVVWAATAFLLAMGLATLASDAPVLSFFGVHRRYAGLLLYGAVVVLFLTVVRRFDDRSVRSIVAAVVASGAIAALYGLVQMLGADPFNWNRIYGDAAIATLGNPNFAAGFLGICLPATCWVVLDRHVAQGWRWVCGLLALLTAVVIVGTESAQGPLAAGAGAAVLAVAWLLDREPRQRRGGLAGLAVLGVLGGATLGTGLTGRGPLAGLAAEAGFALRGDYWRAAVNMLADHPLLGVGLDRYAVNYRLDRSIDAVLRVDLPQGNDAAHSVLLHLFSGGGAVVGLAYLAVVGCTAWALLSGLRRHAGDRRLLLGGVGGAWLAYQVQSVVSIDVPALASLHWILAGAVVVVAAPPRVRELRLPWGPDPGQPPSKKEAGRRVLVSGGAVVVLGLVSLWAGTLWFRADSAAGAAERRIGAEDYESALDRIDDATRLAPWEWNYVFQRANALQLDGRAAESLPVFRSAFEQSRGDLKPPLAAARIAVRIEDAAAATGFYEQALEVEPQHPGLKVEFAEHLLRQDDRDRAVQLLGAATAIETDHARANELLDELGPGTG